MRRTAPALLLVLALLAQGLTLGHGDLPRMHRHLPVPDVAQALALASGAAFHGAAFIPALLEGAGGRPEPLPEAAPVAGEAEGPGFEAGTVAMRPSAAPEISWAWPPSAGVLMAGPGVHGHVDPGWHAHGWVEAGLLQALNSGMDEAAASGAWAPPPRTRQLDPPSRQALPRPDFLGIWQSWQGQPATPPPRRAG